MELAVFTQEKPSTETLLVEKIRAVKAREAFLGAENLAAVAILAPNAMLVELYRKPRWTYVKPARHDKVALWIFPCDFMRSAK